METYIFILDILSLSLSLYIYIFYIKKYLQHPKKSVKIFFFLQKIILLVTEEGEIHSCHWVFT